MSSTGSGDGEQKRWDVVALGNLCVDIVVPLDVVRRGRVCTWLTLRELAEAARGEHVLTSAAKDARSPTAQPRCSWLRRGVVCICRCHHQRR